MHRTDITGCRMPCDIVSFRTAKVTDQYDGMTFKVNYADTRVVMKEEFLSHDLNSIISAVGGSLGLFLGFSCFGCLTKIFGIILSRQDQSVDPTRASLEERVERIEKLIMSKSLRKY